MRVYIFVYSCCRVGSARDRPNFFSVINIRQSENGCVEDIQLYGGGGPSADVREGVVGEGEVKDFSGPIFS